MRWPMVEQEYGPSLCKTDVFSETEAGAGGDEKAQQRWKDLRKRVIEHNVRVVAKYYTRVQFSRLTQLLDLSEDETETYISDLVTAKTIYARIDRPARLVSFKRPSDADDVLNEWSGNMKSLLGLLERIDHLITKEVRGLITPILSVSRKLPLTTPKEMMARIAPKMEAMKA